MFLVLFGLAAAGIGAVFGRFRVARLSAGDFQPELADTFVRWQRLKLRRIDIFLAAVVVLFGGLAFAVQNQRMGDAIGPLVGITFWTGLITSFVLQRKAAKLEVMLNAGRRHSSVAEPT